MKEFTRDDPEYQEMKDKLSGEVECEHCDGQGCWHCEDTGYKVDPHADVCQLCGTVYAHGHHKEVLWALTWPRETMPQRCSRCWDT